MVLLIGCQVSLHKIGSRAQLSLVTFHLNTYSSLIHAVKPSTTASLFVIVFYHIYVLWISPSLLLHLIPPVKFLNSMICIISSFSSSASFSSSCRPATTHILVLHASSYLCLILLSLSSRKQAKKTGSHVRKWQWGWRSGRTTVAVTGRYVGHLLRCDILLYLLVCVYLCVDSDKQDINTQRR